MKPTFRTKHSLRCLKIPTFSPELPDDADSQFSGHGCRENLLRAKFEKTPLKNLPQLVFLVGWFESSLSRRWSDAWRDRRCCMASRATGTKTGVPRKWRFCDCSNPKLTQNVAKLSKPALVIAFVRFEIWAHAQSALGLKFWGQFHESKVWRNSTRRNFTLNINCNFPPFFILAANSAQLQNKFPQN